MTGKRIGVRLSLNGNCSSIVLAVGRGAAADQRRWVDDRVRAELLRSLLASHRRCGRFAAELFHADAAFLRSAVRRLKVFQTAFRIASTGAMILGATAIFKGVFKWQVPEMLDRIGLTFLPVVLPAVAAWCLAMIPLFEHKRRAGLYQQMVVRLKAKRVELVESKARTTAAAVVESCERLLPTEFWEWSGTRGRK